MTATDPDNLGEHDDVDDLVGAVQNFLGRLPEKDGLRSAIDEGRQIAEIVAPLGLPQELLAAVHAYPLYRDNFLDRKSLQNRPLSDISRFIIGLEQLNQFSLPDDWQPGEALAVQQSEAL